MNRTKKLEQIEKDKEIEDQQRAGSPVSPRNAEKQNHNRNKSIVAIERPDRQPSPARKLTALAHEITQK